MRNENLYYKPIKTFIMKSTNKFSWFFALLFISANFTTASAQTLKDFFNNSETPLTYLGVDFTKAKLINDPGGNPMDIRNRLYNSINQVVVAEPKKYDIAGAFRKSAVTSDLTAVTAANEKINAEQIMSSSTADFNRLKADDIAGVVKALGINGKKGIGLLFVMEGMKKEEKNAAASVWTVLIDMQSKKVLLTERLESKPAGFGFRNFWASTIKGTLDAIEKRKYSEWKGQHG
jgi:hypothetical protein